PDEIAESLPDCHLQRIGEPIRRRESPGCRADNRSTGEMCRPSGVTGRSVSERSGTALVDLEQADLAGDGDREAAPAHAELGVEVLQGELDGRLGQAEIAGDLLVGRVARQELQYLRFPHAQELGAEARLRRLDLVE